MSDVKFLTSDGRDASEVKIHVPMPSEEAMLYAASQQIRRIRTRTESGVDVHGTPFVPYKRSYAKIRLKKGRNVSPVDLTMSGRMLDSMQAEVRSPQEFAITVQDRDAATYGRAHNEGVPGRLPRRRWFDTSPDEKQQMQKELFGFDKLR
jgi:hypothetical protein